MSDLADILNKASSPRAKPKTDKDLVSAVMPNGLIPPNYHEVRLTGSMGRLQAPSLLHFRNFTVQESLLLAQISQKEDPSIIVQLLNACIWPGDNFDCGLLHREDAIEIMINLYGTWWGSVIEGFYYAVDETQEMGTGTNRSIAEIPVNSIHIKSLPDDVRDPTRLTDPDTGYKVEFIQPCLIFNKIIKDWLDTKYMDQEIKFNDYKWILRENEKRDTAGRSDLIRFNIALAEQYEAYEYERLTETLRVRRALLVKSINGQNLMTLEAKLQSLQSIPLTMWEDYDKISEEKFDFGVDSEVEFICSIKHVPIKRRFSFRLMDFVPSVDGRRVSAYSVSFG
jgi:hypothetical protein